VSFLPGGVWQGSDPEEVWDPNAQMAFEETMPARALIESDRAVIAQRIFDRMVERAPGWRAADGNLDTWIIEEFATVASEIRAEALTVPDSIFMTYGQEVLGIPAQVPVPAVGTTTWTASDDRGYQIPTGTQIVVPRTGDELVVFEVMFAREIPVGETVATDVQVRAMEPGFAGNDLDGPAEPVDPLWWVESIEIDQPTERGVDGQTVDQYLSELILLLRVVALRPILPWDYAVLAMRVPGVARAIAMDGWRPAVDLPGDADFARADLEGWLTAHAVHMPEQAAMIRSVVATLTPDAAGGSWGHQREVTLIVTGADGLPVPAATRAQVRDYLEGLREVNFLVNVIDAEYQPVDIGWEVTAFVEQDIDVVHELCDAALRDALSPANWRLGTTSPSIAAGEVIAVPTEDAVADGFEPSRQTIRVHDIVGLLDRQRGVDWVGPVTIQGVAEDFQLDGPTTLPLVGDIEGLVHAG
jgi:hypothetical protein